ncbi:MAG: CCA tRNA nucleotidyltransferase [Candidatus Micrarchaeia archaeon]
MEAEKEKKLRNIFGQVLKEIKPDDLEVKSTIAHANEVMSRLEKIIPKDVELRIVGSIARSTNLSGDSDIDIFMLFNKRYDDEEVSKLGLKYAKMIIGKKKHERLEIKYAEHAYARLYLDDFGIKVDLVPAFKISNINEMGTSVDRSPLHTDFINSNFTDRQRDDVRLLKYLLKAHHIYGAEVKVKGFSGYLCELLVYTFGSLEKLLDAATKFSLPMCIVPKDKSIVRDESIFRKFNAQFVVIDPVDPNRNVAAGVSIESLSRFVVVARELLKKPSLRFFYGKGFSSLKTPSLLKAFEKNSGLRPYLIVVKVPDESEDIVWPQLNKIGNAIMAEAAKEGFETYIYSSFISKGEGLLLYFMPDDRSASRMMKGPSTFKGEYSEKFIEKHSKALGLIIKDDMLYAIEKKRYRNASDALKAIVRVKEMNLGKEIKMSKAKVLSNIPRKYAPEAYAALLEKISL